MKLEQCRVDEVSLDSVSIQQRGNRVDALFLLYADGRCVGQTTVTDVLHDAAVREKYDALQGALETMAVSLLGGTSVEEPTAGPRSLVKGF